MAAVKSKKKLPPRRQRLYFIIFSAFCVVIAAVLILSAFRDNIVFFRTPTDVMLKPAKPGERLRLGGLVKAGSVLEKPEGGHKFIITDGQNDLLVIYEGMLPSLFREGQGVVAYGAMGVDNKFHATEILAKHDEKYMPPEVYKSLTEKGGLHK
jgi:cytochrome c-type biogenesis protein CcmE